MRGGWVIGVLVVVGACGAEGSGSGTVTTNAPVVTTGPTTPAPAPTTPPPPTTGPAAVIGLEGEWEVTSGIVNGEPVQLIDGAPITLMAEGSRLFGSAACNSYDFTFEPREVGIEIVTRVVTEILCESPLAELEELYLVSLGPTATYVVDGTTLTWQTPTATWTFARVRP